MGVEKVHKDDTARTFEFLFRFNRVWINSRLLLLLFIEMLNVDEMETLYRLFYVFDDVMTRDHVTYCLIFGSLIGSYRHHGVVPWDSDVDVLVSEADRWENPASVAQPPAGNLNCTNSKRGSGNFSDAGDLMRGKQVRWVINVDLFFCTETSTKLILMSRHAMGQRYRKQDTFPLRRRSFGNRMVPAPCDPIRIMARYWGQRIQLRDNLPAVRIQTTGSALCTAGQPVSFCTQGSHGQCRSSTRVCGRGVGTQWKEIEHTVKVDFDCALT